MTCRDFERTWNEILDAEAGAGWSAESTTANERALLEHAAGCPFCGQVDARYQVLRRAIRAWASPPAPAAGLADRILAEIQAPTPSVWPIYGEARRDRKWPIIAGLAAMAATAAALAIALPHLNRTMDRTQRNGTARVLHITHADRGRDAETNVDARALNMALSEATAATWDLARSASEPAARLSRQVLDAATGPERSTILPVSFTGSGSVDTTVSVPSLDSLAPDTAAAGAMLQQVGDRFTDGVRPLSDTARHAFGFLLGTALAKPEVPVNPPAQKGA
jgi:hypothetical protein